AFPAVSRAAPAPAPDVASSPFDLINAVNALRVSNGLPAYSISPILMFTAQNQADFMAANGIVTHAGPGGIGLTERLLAAGYPLAGDLSLGGFRAENITSGSESMTAQAAVNQWMGDAPHLSTMLSPDLTEIGAGVSIANGRVYYVIDAALPTTSGAPQGITPAVESGATVPAGEVPAPIVVISTPNGVGDVFHEVLAGQTLWQIAISYNVRVEDVRRLNSLADTKIYPGDKLLISTMADMTGTPTTVPTSTKTPRPVSTQTLLPTSTQAAATSTPAIANSAPANSANVAAIMIGIIALAILGGGLFTWLGNAGRE
ncbi:MAG: CAP domain-containing protein, partial [Anaerolineales bacterium]|nr:CAP domain-containing protein [Anaerolineales bacterium]